MKKFLILLITICLFLVIASSGCWARTVVYRADDDEMKMYTKRIEENPGDPKLYCDRAVGYGSRGEFDKEIADFMKAMEVNPNYQQGYRGYGAAYIIMADKAQSWLEAKTAYEKAIAVYNQLTELYPQSEEAYYLRGFAYQRLGNRAMDFAEAKTSYDQAVADYNKSIALNKKYHKSYYYRAEIYMETGEYGRAIADYTYLSNVDGFRTPPATRCKLGSAYVLIGKYGKALAEYSAAIKEQHPSLYTEAYQERGKIYLRFKKYDEAIADFAHMVDKWEYEATERMEHLSYFKPVKRVPKETDKLKCAEAHYLRAYAYYGKGEYDKAFTDCARALELYYDHADARILKSKLYKTMSRS